MEIDIGELIIDEIINIPDIELDYIKETPETEEITILPTKEGVSLEGLFHKVIIPDEPNFIEENIKQGISIFGKEGTLIPTAVDGGYDLSKIGTTVTVEATGAIGKGDRWVGVTNENFEPTLGSQATTSYGMFYSSDFSVGIHAGTGTITPTSTGSVNIGLYNAESQTYENLLGYVGGIAPSLTHDLICCDVNEDGTLVIYSKYNAGTTGRRGVAVFEVDKENRTATAYYQELNADNGTTMPMLAKDYLIQQCTSGGNRVYKYDWEQHKFVQIAKCAYNLQNLPAFSGTSTTSTSTVLGQTGTKVWVNDNVLLFLNDNYLVRYYLSESSASNSYVAYSSLNSKFKKSQISISKDYLIYCEQSSYNVSVYNLNSADLKITLLRTFRTNYLFTTSSSKPSVADGNYLVRSKYIYDISNIENADPTLIYTHTGGLEGARVHTFNIHKWINATRTFFYGFPQGSEAQYLISPATQGTETGKFYGIASNSLSLGDVGEAQLLFAT